MDGLEGHRGLGESLSQAGSLTTWWARSRIKLQMPLGLLQLDRATGEVVVGVSGDESQARWNTINRLSPADAGWGSRHIGSFLGAQAAGVRTMWPNY